MSDWQESFLLFSGLPEVGRLLLASEPAWIWARDGSRVLWANPAGGRSLGASNFSAVGSRRWAANTRLSRAIVGLSGSLSDRGTLARLPIGLDAAAAPVTCRCQRVRAGQARGVLVVGVETDRGAVSVSQLAGFYSGEGLQVFVLDASGELVAGSRPEFEDPDRPAPQTVAFPSEGGQSFRLCFHTTEPETREADPVVPVDEQSQAADDAGRPAAAELAPSKDLPEAADRRGKPVSQILPGEELPVPAPISSPEEQRPPSPPLKVVPVPRGRPGAGAGFRSGRQAAAAEQEMVGDPGASPAQADPAPPQSIMAGRVARELSRNPVRFLWQTDAADRFLFVSPGLPQVVGRNAEIVGERWQEVAQRLRLDPAQRISRALAQRDTWSGQTAWWPVEGSEVRVPAELTALPIFGGDQSFQGYRGFGVLKPAEALMPAAFEARFGSAGQAALPPVEQIPPYEEAVATTPVNVVPIRADLERVADGARLTQQERNAFEEIAAALRERVLDIVEAPHQDVDEPLGAGSNDAVGSSLDLPAEDGGEGLQRGAGLEGQDADEASEALPPDEGAIDPAREDADFPTHDFGPIAADPPVAGPVVPAGEPAADAAAHRDDVSIAAPAEFQRRIREMAAILDTATDGVVVLDSSGLIESTNASAEALFGLEADEMRGTDFGLLLTPDSREAVMDYLSGLNGSGVASLLNEGREVKAIAGTGAVPLFITMGRISGENGGRFCAVLRDLTQWKHTEAELVAAKRAAEAASSQKSEFLARVSHEIRTPLNAIIGFAEVMIEERFGPVENDRYREYLRDIRTSGEHVVSLVNDLLDISKIEAGKLDLSFDAVPLNELVQETIASMQPQANRARVVLRSSLSREVPAIVADRRTLKQIVLNLLSNSVKFTGPGGQVIASTSLAESGEAVLRIRDTGDGMSEEELSRALEPFRQIATARLADRTGTGLGLPLTKALVEANRASLAIRSARGEGTVVTITFPPTRVLSE